MNSSRPYLVRALYEWIVDNDCTPHLLVSAEYPGVQVPPGFASDGQIVLNASPSAVRHLHMDNQAVSFEGRFGGVAHSLFVPAGAMLAIYARENGQGMAFPPPDGLHTVTADPVQMTPESGEQAAADRVPSLRSVPVPVGSEDGGAEPPPDGAGRSGGRPQLKRVK